MKEEAPHNTLSTATSEKHTLPSPVGKGLKTLQLRQDTPADTPRSQKRKRPEHADGQHGGTPQQPPKGTGELDMSM